MRNKQIAYLIAGIVLIAAFFGCTTDDKSKQNVEEPITIQVEGAKFDIIESENLLTSSEFVFLESKEESHFSEMSYFLLSTEEFYILDPQKKHMVFRFNSEGKFLNTIGKKGGGPGEYNSAVDALVDGDNIEILSNNVSSDVYRYSKDGDFIEKQIYEPKYPVSFVKVPETTDYLFYCSFGDFKVSRVSKQGQFMDSILSQKQEDRIGMTLDVLTACSDGSVLLNEALYNIIWKWNGSDFVESYFLDFGDYTFFQGDKDEERYFQQEQGQGRWSIRWYQENEHYLYITLLFIPPDVESVEEITILHLLYDKENKKTYQLGNGDIKLRLQWPFVITNDNKLYLSGVPVEMAEWDPWMKVVKDRNLPFDIEGNPIVVIVDLDKLVKDDLN